MGLRRLQATGQHVACVSCVQPCKTLLPGCVTGAGYLVHAGYVSDVTMFGLRMRPKGVDFVVSLGPISWFCGSKSVTVFWAQKRRHILVLVLFLWW